MPTLALLTAIDSAKKPLVISDRVATPHFWFRGLVPRGALVS